MYLCREYGLPRNDPNFKVRCVLEDHVLIGPVALIVQRDEPASYRRLHSMAIDIRDVQRLNLLISALSRF